MVIIMTGRVRHCPKDICLPLQSRTLHGGTLLSTLAQKTATMKYFVLLDKLIR